MQPELISGVFMVIVTIIEVLAARDRRNAKKDRERAQARAARREEESRLSMKLQKATCALALVTAKKMAGHQTNGDVEEAMDEAEAAQKAYEDFLDKLAVHEFNKI